MARKGCWYVSNPRHQLAAAGHWSQGPTLWRRLDSMAVLEVEMSQLLDPHLQLSRWYSITSLAEINQIIGSDATLVR
jgi:hypothetical protein